MEGFTPAKSGVVFNAKTGKIIVFKARSVTVIRIWPQPAGWRKTSGSPEWTHIRPEIEIPNVDVEQRILKLETPPIDEYGQYLIPQTLPVRSWFTRQEELSWLRCFAQIPARIRALVSRYNSERQFHMLSFLARTGDPGVDLTLSNFALAWALANSFVFRVKPVQRPLRSARALLKPGKKQRDILSWLGFPGNEPTRRLLAKIIPPAISVNSLLYLKQSLGDPIRMKALSHLPPRVNAGALRIATDPLLLTFCSPTLLEDVCFRHQEDRHPQTAPLVRDVVAMLHRLYPGRGRRVFRRRAELLEFHDDLVGQINHSSRAVIDIPFPPPPIPGTADGAITPLETSEDVIEEGRCMHHCVASFQSAVIYRRIYLYRMMLPERGTLALRRGKKRWTVMEFKGPLNAPPSAEAWRCVHKWLADHYAAAGDEQIPEEEDEVFEVLPLEDVDWEVPPF